jgi:hypothetical protein
MVSLRRQAVNISLPYISGIHMSALLLEAGESMDAALIGTRVASVGSRHA